MTQTAFTPPPAFTRAILGIDSFFMLDIDFVRDFDNEFFGETFYNSTSAIDGIAEAHFRGFRISAVKIWE